VRDVVLVTGRDMPVVETETPLLLAALTDRGVDASIETWRDEASAHARLVVVRTTWDYVPHHAAFLDWARAVAAVTRLVNPVEVLEWNSHKRYLIDLASAGVDVVPTTLVARGAPYADQRAALAEYADELVIKPAVSVGAIGASRVAARSADAATHLAVLAEAGDVLVQPFEPAVLDGERSLLYFGGEFSHAVRKVPAAGDYRVQAQHGGTVAPYAATSAERAVAATALAAAPGPLAYARVDLVTTVNGPAIMELELVEPELFLRTDAAAAGRFADYLVGLLGAA
jgi:glutathione synthase/RimK-type ligase-like ATP-grasp enzyme